jgi:hypothetical protein
VSSAARHRIGLRLAAALVIALTAASLAPARAPAQTTADVAYDEVAAWLFQRYGDGVLGVVRRKVVDEKPAAEAVLAAELPRLKEFLAKHRDAFMAVMAPALREHVPEAEIAALAARVRIVPLALDAGMGRRLLAVDADFQRNGQTLLRTMAYELDIVVEQMLATKLKP